MRVEVAWQSSEPVADVLQQAISTYSKFQIAAATDHQITIDIEANIDAQISLVHFTSQTIGAGLGVPTACPVT